MRVKLTSNGRTMRRDHIGNAIEAFRRREVELGLSDRPMARSHLNEVLDMIAASVVPGRTMFCGSYGYTPMNSDLTIWRTTDHGELRVSLLSILVEYLDDAREIAERIWHWETKEIVNWYTRDAVRDQETYESL